MSYRTRFRTVTAKVETTAGTDAAPTVSANAVEVVDPQFQGGIESVPTGALTGGLDLASPVPGGGGATWNGTAYLKGSGTGGVAADMGVFLQGSGLAETLTAADVTGTAQGGTSTTITLHSGASATDDAYKGMIIVPTNNTPTGWTNELPHVIIAYNGTTKVATVERAFATTPTSSSTFAIKANALYIPASQGLKNLSIYDYLHHKTAGQNSKLRKVLGAMGNCQITIPNRGLPVAAFNFTGQFAAPGDVSHPGAATLDNVKPRVFIGADIYLDTTLVKLNQITLDLGNALAQFDDPTATYGVDVGDITARQITGRINPRAALASERDVWADLLAGTERRLWIRWGSAAGNRHSILLPEILFQRSEDQDINGLLHEGIPFAASANPDTGFYYCQY